MYILLDVLECVSLYIIMSCQIYRDTTHQNIRYEIHYPTVVVNEFNEMKWKMESDSFACARRRQTGFLLYTIAVFSVFISHMIKLKIVNVQ